MTNTLSDPPARPRCPRCLRPQAACICRWIRPVDNGVELLVLQHPSEAGAAKGTAGLLSLSLARCTVHVGEQFAAADLGPLAHAALLYPAADAAAPPAAPATTKRLILLDATWRKSRKLLHLNPWLLALPRLALQDPPASRYGALRRAHAPHQLSSLEAGVLALQQLEGSAARYAPLLEAFEGFLEQRGLHNYNPAPQKTHRVPRV